MATTTKNRLNGHSVLAEGAPFKGISKATFDKSGGIKAGRRYFERIRAFGGYGYGSATGGHGIGVCSCGATSEKLPSGAQRRAWHRAHKDEMRKAGK